MQLFVVQMDLIVVSDTGTVSSIDLGNVASDLVKKMSLSYVESLLAKLVRDKWMSCVSKCGSSTTLSLLPEFSYAPWKSSWGWGGVLDLYLGGGEGGAARTMKP